MPGSRSLSRTAKPLFQRPTRRSVLRALSSLIPISAWQLRASEPRSPARTSPFSFTSKVEPIYKLQPHRTMHLQGADAYGASAAMHGASDTGFTVSGVFRDPADFAVLVLWDRDDFYGHPR